MTPDATNFDDFLESLQPLSVPRTAIDPAAREPYEEAAVALRELPDINREVLSELIRHRPEWVPILASVVGFSQEQLKNVLRHRLGSAGWIGLARNKPAELVDLLDEEHALVEQIESERNRAWSYGDVLFERVASRSRAGRAIGRGRNLEDEVESVVQAIGLTYELRSQFVGRGGRRAPCDVAIPGAGGHALIVCAVKGFDSTGSKLTDAVREIEAMADVRDARQFVYAVVDGIGWLNRQADLRRIHALWRDRSINGLFSRAQLDAFRQELGQAAQIHKLT